MERNDETIECLYEQFRRFPAIATDSRKVTAGSIFFALKGDKFDGNRFASSALEQGAALAVVDDPSVCADGGEYLCVDDVLDTLQRLAAHHRLALGIPVLGIVGSNGKTTTKELTVAVLSKKYRVTATVGNLNNHIGVPLTLLSMTPETEFGVVEMGASSQGEIASLCRIAAPDYGLITNIGRAHLEGFGGEEGIRKGKGELYDHIAAHGGEAFVRADDEILVEMAAQRAGMKVWSYYSAVADGWQTSLTGDYNRFNVAAAIAVGRRFGVEECDMRDAIASYRPRNNRSQSTDTGRNLLVADCYNANPSSMASSLNSFFALADDTYNRKAVVLGDMLELGRWADEEHRRIVDMLLASDCERIYLVGGTFAKVVRPADNQTKSIMTFPDAETLKAELTAHPLSGYAVLVKGSHSVGLERLLEMF